MKTNIKLLLVAALAMMSVHGWAGTRVIYFDTNGFTFKGSATNFAVYLWNDGGTNEWVTLDLVSGTLYSATIPDTREKCIFCAMNSYGATGWDNRKAQTDNQTLTAYNLYTVTSSNTDNGDIRGGWSNYVTGHTLTFTKTGSGSVSGKVDGSSQSSPVSSVEEGTEIELEATPSSSSYVFTCWKVGDDIVSYDNPYTFDMPDADITVTAEFETNRKSSGGCGNCFTVE